MQSTGRQLIAQVEYEIDFKNPGTRLQHFSIEAQFLPQVLGTNSKVIRAPPPLPLTHHLKAIFLQAWGFSNGFITWFLKRFESRPEVQWMLFYSAVDPKNSRQRGQVHKSSKSIIG